MSERLDPENCPQCGVSWINEEIAYGPPSPPKMILVLARPRYYRCEVCGAKSFCERFCCKPVSGRPHYAASLANEAVIGSVKFSLTGATGRVSVA